MASLVQHMEKTGKDSERLRFACDIDDVLADTWQAFLRRLNQLAGTQFSTDEVAPFVLVQNFPGWRQYLEIDEVVKTFWESEEFNLNLEPVVGAVEGLTKLTKIADLQFYLTGRPKSIREVTKKWLESWNFTEAELITRPEGLPYEEIGNWKLKIIRESGVDFIIEDNPHFAQLVGEARVILLERPHNSQFAFSDERVGRAANWEAIEKMTRTWSVMTENR